MEVKKLSLNEIGKIKLKLLTLFVDSYYKNRDTGSIILIELRFKETVGAAIIN